MNEAKTRSGSPNHKLGTFWSDRAQGRAETDLMDASLGAIKSENGVSRSPKPPRLAPVKDAQAEAI